MSQHFDACCTNPDLLKPIGQLNEDNMSLALAYGFTEEFVKAKLGDVKAGMGLQHTIDNMAFQKDEPLVEKTLSKMDPNIAARLRDAMVQHSVITFE